MMISCSMMQPKFQCEIVLTCTFPSCLLFCCLSVDDAPSPWKHAIFERHRQFLVENCYASSLRLCCYSEDVLSRFQLVQLREVEERSGSRVHNIKLLRILTAGGSRSFAGFVRALEEQNPAISCLGDELSSVLSDLGASSSQPSSGKILN